MENAYNANKKAYNSLAEKWSQKYLKADVRRLTDLFAKRLKPGSRILDIGCGPGRDTKELSLRGFNVIGADFSDEMLKIAKGYFPEGKFQKMDMLDLKFPDGSFDGVFAMASFLNIRKRDAASVLWGFLRVLKNNGILAIAVKKGKGEIFETEDGETRLFSLYSEAELDSLLENAGFKKLEGFTERAGSNTRIETVAVAVK
jgi:ubiquinone/menaquinone biosynthesis C-methylase UbiE